MQIQTRTSSTNGKLRNKKLNSHLHLPRHNLPKGLIEFCPHWVQSYAFFQIQYLLVMNFLCQILSIDEQSFLDLPSSPMPLSIQENSPIPVYRMSFVLSSMCIKPIGRLLVLNIILVLFSSLTKVLTRFSYMYVSHSTFFARNRVYHILALHPIHFLFQFAKVRIYCVLFLGDQTNLKFPQLPL